MKNLFIVYLSSFIKIKFDNGLFNIGKEFQDNCGDDDNCMTLLTIQVFVIILFKPFARFFVGVFWP